MYNIHVHCTIHSVCKSLWTRSGAELFTEGTSIILVLYINYAFCSENVETRKSGMNDWRYEQEFETKLLSYVFAESTLIDPETE